MKILVLGSRRRISRIMAAAVYLRQQGHEVFDWMALDKQCEPAAQVLARSMQMARECDGAIVVAPAGTITGVQIGRLQVMGKFIVGLSSELRKGSLIREMIPCYSGLKAALTALEEAVGLELAGEVIHDKTP